jgi:3'-phosphoadenosine 5'-phosphosulfate sulfotransferase (PAPS reductase)/FAD synthetase
LLKTSLVKKYIKTLCEDYNVIQYKGIAADEDYRMTREQNQNPNHRYPLRDWGWEEADALAYCRGLGFDWEGLYDIFNRVSCWCCPLKQYDELRKTRQHFPDLWAKLLDLDARQGKPFAHGYSVADFNKRFAFEDELTAAGHSIKNKRFFTDLKRLLNEEATVESILAERRAEAEQISLFD